VHQFGFDGTQNVRPYEYTRSNRFGNRRVKEQITNKLGRKQTVTRKTVSGVSFVKVKGFTRHIHIPARPYLVFRPEDPQRMAEETTRFLDNRANPGGNR
jgi:phage gpG-like protein